MKHASLFLGIGGFDLAAQKMGWENVFMCEKNKYLYDFLKVKYPKSIIYEDIKQTNSSKWKGKIDILTGGFPCQPFSLAGKREGTADDRYLWPEMLRTIREIRPRWILGENVCGILDWNQGLVFEQICTDLEDEGYQVTSYILPAAAVDAPHRRYRVWFVAYAQGTGFQSRKKRQRKRQFGRRNIGTLSKVRKRFLTNSNSFRSHQLHKKMEFQKSSGQSFDSSTEQNYWEKFPTQPPICDGNDGIRSELLRRVVRNHTDGLLTEKEENQLIYATMERVRKESIRAAGNAVVPQVVFLGFFIQGVLDFRPK